MATTLVPAPPYTSGYRPPWRFSLNRTSPLCAGLAFYYPLGDCLSDLVSGRTLKTDGAAGVLWESSGALGGNGVGSCSHVTGSQVGYSIDVLPHSQTTNITQSLWVTFENTDFFGEQVFFNYGGGSDGWAMETTSTASELQILINGIARVATGFVPPLQQPIHIGLRRLNTTWQYFMNGQLVGNTSTTNPNTPTTGMQIGYQITNTGRQFNGNISNVMGWTRALTTQEMFNLYAPQTRWSFLKPRQKWIPVDAAVVSTFKAAWGVQANIIYPGTL